MLFRGDGSNSFGALDGDGGGGILFNADLRRSLQKADRLLHLEGKIEAARRRRENALFLKESASRAANLRHAEVSREALQQKWLDDADRARQAFELRRTSDDQVALRKVGVLLLLSLFI